MNYYNEFEPFAAKWLVNLAGAGHIGAGRVDSRSIKEVSHVDVAEAVQAHFFAGIGVWSHALRIAGWPDDRPVWTGSCPCQPFSVAGRGKGVEDERHLWPEWFRLIRECRPPVVFGEQVASPDGLAWLDAVRADMEGAGYAFGAADLCAAGVGAPHIRQRLYFVGIRQDGLADSGQGERRRRTDRARNVGDGSASGRIEGAGHSEPCGEACGLAHHQQGRGQLGRFVPEDSHAQPRLDADGRGEARGVADASDERLYGRRAGEARDGRDTARLESQRLRDARGVADDGREGRRQVGTDVRGRGEGGRAEGVDERPLHRGTLNARGVGHADGQHSGRNAGAGHREEAGARLRGGGDESRTPGAVGQRMGEPIREGLEGHAGHGDDGHQPGRDGAQPHGPTPTSGFWSNPDWVACRDGKQRPVEPGSFPLAHGAPQRVGRLRAYGNAIVSEVAATFIRAVMEHIDQ